MSSESRIRVLPDLLVNKIAAGEVVERPASVVKELVENAIDAGANRVAVAIEDGGKQLIRVTDDGTGMTPDELRLAVRPHATSKLVTEDDLYAIGTMGFRGEALASISSVSKMRIVSRTPDAQAGYELRVTGETIDAAQAAGCPVGTTVDVRDLFFNVPARRKFLRAKATEVGHVNEQFARIALALPSIAFELANGARVTQSLAPCAHRLERIATFYSEELASAMLHIEREERGLAIDAYAAPPSQSRATAQWQYTFINGRYIRDRFIQHAIKEAYRGLMEPNRHAVIFLFLSTDPHNLDVNVHPTKTEVRWADSNLVHSQVLSTLREAFQRSDLTPALRTDRGRAPIDPAEQDRIRREMAEAFKAQPPIQPGRSAQGPEGAQDPAGRGSPAGGSYATSQGAAHSPGGADPMEAWRSLYTPPAQEDVGHDRDTSKDTTAAYGHHGAASHDRSGMENRAPLADAEGRPRAIQLHNLYLVAETEDGIIIIDQHALHERVMYEQLRQRITEGPLTAQRLLLPETIRATSSDLALLEANQELFEKLGIEATAFGTNAIAVHTFPSLLKDADVVGFMRDLLDRLAQQPAGTSTEVVIHAALDMMACKAAVKAGDPLTSAEIDALISQRHLIEKASSCPHGRPTVLRLTKSDLEREFKRR